GQVLPVDRGALARRWGTELLSRLSQLTGQRAELITPCRPPIKYEVGRDLEVGTTHSESIESLATLLLRKLLEKLCPQRLGTCRLECRFRWENRPSQALTVRLCEATNDWQHLHDLLRLQLESLRLEAPLVGLQLAALEVAPLIASQEEFLEGGQRDEARACS